MFAMLAQRGKVEVKVYYTWGDAVLKDKYDPGFGKSIEWDIPLLEGYAYEFMKNRSADPGSHHFNGIDNPELINTLVHWKADAVMVYGWSFKSHLKVIRYFHGKVPVLFRGDSTLLKKQNLVQHVCRTLFLKWVFRSVDFALYVGTHNKNYFIKHGLRGKQLVFAPHAIDNDRFGSDASSIIAKKNMWRNYLQINNDDIIFLYAGKLDQNKNVTLLIHAFNALNESGTHLVIAGNGIMEDQLKNAYESIPNIHFLPFQNQGEMPLLYDMADVFVLPSISETWGLSINEAMACGNAVLVSSGCGAAIDLVHNGRNGYEFLNNNAQDLEEKMKLLVQYKQKLKAFGMASASIIADWNFENVCMAIEDVLIHDSV
jgi:glycosyltransferase involved in cell wall biosynthesis